MALQLGTLDTKGVGLRNDQIAFSILLDSIVTISKITIIKHITILFDQYWQCTVKKYKRIPYWAFKKREVILDTFQISMKYGMDKTYGLERVTWPRGTQKWKMINPIECHVLFHHKRYSTENDTAP